MNSCCTDDRHMLHSTHTVSISRFLTICTRSIGKYVLQRLETHHNGKGRKNGNIVGTYGVILQQKNYNILRHFILL